MHEQMRTAISTMARSDRPTSGPAWGFGIGSASSGPAEVTDRLSVPPRPVEAIAARDIQGMQLVYWHEHPSEMTLEYPAGVHTPVTFSKPAFNGLITSDPIPVAIARGERFRFHGKPPAVMVG